MPIIILNQRQLQCPLFLMAQCIYIIDTYINLLKAQESLVKEPIGTIF